MKSKLLNNKKLSTKTKEIINKLLEAGIDENTISETILYKTNNKYAFDETCQGYIGESLLLAAKGSPKVTIEDVKKIYIQVSNGEIVYNYNNNNDKQKTPITKQTIFKQISKKINNISFDYIMIYMTFIMIVVFVILSFVFLIKNLF